MLNTDRPSHLPKCFKFTRIQQKITLAASLAFVVVPAFALAAHATYRDSPKAVLDQAWQIVDRDYVDPTFNHVDWRQVRQSLLSQSYTSRDEAYTALREALKKLDDPYTRFMTPDEFQAFNDDSNGKLVGVGLQLASDPQTHALTVIKPIENSPALRAGIQAGDHLMQIDGQSTQGLSLEESVKLVRGAPGTKVTVTLQRQQNPPFDVVLTRTELRIPTVESALQVEGSHRVGYIRLNQFGTHAAEEMQQAITTLKQQRADELVLDLRDNPGGRLDQGIDIARMWIDRGDIVRTVDRQGETEQVRANHTALTDLPLAVLVNGNSASASEILTGALKDNHRAVIVGTQTFGKAVVQSVNPLADGSDLNVTIAHYFTPAGLDINHRGITPDRVVSLTETQQQALRTHPDWLGTEHDPQYEQATSALNRL